MPTLLLLELDLGPQVRICTCKPICIYKLLCAGGHRAIGSKDINAALSPELLFYFHIGPVWAVAAKGDIIATGGDDKWVIMGYCMSTVS